LKLLITVLADPHQGAACNHCKEIDHEEEAHSALRVFYSAIGIFSL
jgi:hypothetical protein